jgi:hypothetical protein
VLCGLPVKHHSTVCHGLKKIENLQTSRSDLDELPVMRKARSGRKSRNTR